MTTTGAAATWLAMSSAVAQAPAPPPAVPEQLAEVQGQVSRFTLTPFGELDGVILIDGTQVHLPPHLTAQLASAVRAGDTVTVRGYRSPSAPLVVAVSVTDDNNGQTVVDSGPPSPGSRPPPQPPGTRAPRAQRLSVQGKVQRSLYGPAGDVNGVLLDGTIVRIPRRAAFEAASLLTPGKSLAIQGWALVTPYGTVVEALAVGTSPDHEMQVAPGPR